MTGKEIFALIMAGGQGTRLWPLATNTRPKAFLSFDGTDQSLLQRTISRLSKLTGINNVFVVAGCQHEKELRSQASHIPTQNIILEPARRSTLPCIGLAGLYIRRQNDSGVMVVVPGEQLIQDEPKFRELLKHAAEAAQSHNCVVTLGIKPTFPATRFGYIRLGDEIPSMLDSQLFGSMGFTEKPDEETALQFLSSGRYLWNSGMFIWPVSLLFETISKFAPDIYDALSVIDKAIGTTEEGKIVEQVYTDMRSISIDYAIMEKASDMLVIPTDVGWNDMGTWPEVAETWKTDDASNACIGQHIELDSTGCVIFSPEKLVATVGLQNFIIVETPDALLICPKDRADDVKKLVQKLIN